MNAVLRVSLLCVILLLSCSAFSTADEKPATTTPKDTCPNGPCTEHVDPGDPNESWFENPGGDMYGTMVNCCENGPKSGYERRLQAKAVRVD